MSSKKPILNFAQALRKKPGGEQDAEPVRDTNTSAEQTRLTPGPVATQPASQPELATQIPTLVTQPSIDVHPSENSLLVTQLPSRPVTQPEEKYYPSRVQRRQKSIRLPVNKLEIYEDWQHANRKRFPDFQDLVEYALDWVTSQPAGQLPSQPAGQLPTLINNDLNNLIINDAKAQRALGKYSQVTGKPATPNDHTAYLEVSALPVEAIERGLEETKRRADKAGKQVNSFKYALNVIREEAAKITPTVQNAPESDFSACPNCAGTGFWYPDGTDKGVARCSHESLKGN
jgi:hypothetical protein